MVSRISRTIASWNHGSLSKAGRHTLITSSLLSIPMYYLEAYPLPDSTLNSISKLAKNFLWAKSGNSGGIHLISLNIATLNKIKEGLGIKDLKLTIYAFMSKHVFALSNSKDAIWVELLNLKYSILEIFWIYTRLPIAHGFTNFYVKLFLLQSHICGKILLILLSFLFLTLGVLILHWLLCPLFLTWIWIWLF